MSNIRWFSIFKCGIATNVNKPSIKILRKSSYKIAQGWIRKYHRLLEYYSSLWKYRKKSDFHFLNTVLQE